MIPLMWRCGSCGRESRASREVCWNCGTERSDDFEITSYLPVDGTFRRPTQEPTPSGAEVDRAETGEEAVGRARPGELRAGAAMAAFLGFVGGQILGSVLVGGFAAIVASWQGRDLLDSGVVDDLTQEILVPSVLVGFITGVVVMVALSLVLARRELRSREVTGAAWVAGSVVHRWVGLLVGLVIGLGSLTIPVWMFPPSEAIEPGPLAEMAATPGFPRVAWLLMALVLAPLSEELLFRGVLLGGLTRSFGRVTGGLLVTVLFVALHVLEVFQYPPALVGITVMALAALWLRLRTSAVGPAVAAHFAYNSVISIAVLMA